MRIEELKENEYYTLKDIEQFLRQNENIYIISNEKLTKDKKYKVEKIIESFVYSTTSENNSYNDASFTKKVYYLSK